ncbi:MAG: hypothetical protein WBN16_05210 [Lutimonas sp.]
MNEERHLAKVPFLLVRFLWEGKENEQDNISDYQEEIENSTKSNQRFSGAKSKIRRSHIKDST